MLTGIYPGSFDPVTYGHLDIIRRSAGMCEGNIVPGNLARPRIQEIYACMNRYRKLGTDRKERG